MLIRFLLGLLAATSLCHAQTPADPLIMAAPAPHEKKEKHAELDKCEYPFQEQCKKYDREKEGFDSKSHERFKRIIQKGLENFSNGGVDTLIDYLKFKKLPLKALTPAERKALAKDIETHVHNSSTFSGSIGLLMDYDKQPLFKALRPPEMKHCPLSQFGISEEPKDVDWEKEGESLATFYRGFLETLDIVEIF